MSDAVTTPSADTSAPAADSGGAEASPSQAQPADASAQMRLHLAKKREKRAEPKAEDKPASTPEPEPEEPQEAAEAEPDEQKKPEDDAEPEDDAKPHWAKKLKAEVESAHKKVAEYDGKMRHLTNGARAAHAKISDLTVATEHYKAYASWLEKQVELAGFEVPQVQRDLFAQKLELATLKAQQQRGTVASNDAAVKQAANKIRERANAVISKFPELDPQKNPEARAFWATALAVSPDPKVPAPKLDDLEAQAEAWAMIRRGRSLMADEAAKKKAAPQPRVAPQPTMASQRGVGGRPTPGKQQPITAATMRDYIAKKRASRGA